MIVLDTNMISELWKVETNPNVLAWIDTQPIETLYLSALTVTEIRPGLATMPDCKRRTIYQDCSEREVLPVFTDCMLPLSVAEHLDHHKHDFYSHVYDGHPF